MRSRFSISHQDHVVNQHDRLNLLYGSFLSAIPKSSHGNDAAHFVLKQEPIASEHDAAIQKGLALGTHGAQVYRGCHNKPAQIGVLKDGNDVVKIIFLAAFQCFHAMSACNTPLDLHSRKIDDFSFDFREIFSNCADAVVQGRPGGFSFSRAAGNADNFHGILLSMVPTGAG